MSNLNNWIKEIEITRRSVKREIENIRLKWFIFSKEKILLDILKEYDKYLENLTSFVQNKLNNKDNLQGENSKLSTKE